MSSRQTIKMTITAALAIVCSIPFPALAVHWKVIQVTDNDGIQDREPQVVSQGWVAWPAEMADRDQEVMLYGGQPRTTRQITDNDFLDGHIRISWDLGSQKVTLCWRGRCGPDDTGEIFTLGAKGPIRLTDNNYDDKGPQIWGNHIVWEGQHNNADWEIFRYTPSLDVVQLTKDTLDDYRPAVSGSRILWAKEDPEGDYGQETYFFDGIDEIVRLTADRYMETDHDIDGTHLVWGVFHGSGTVGDWEVHHKRGNDPVEQLTDNDYADLNPVVSGDRIAWIQYDENDYEVMYYDGETIRQLTDNDTDDEEVSISGERVVWVQYGRAGTSSYDGQILVFDDSDDSTTVLEDGHDDGFYPQIAGDLIAWQVWDGHDFEIMLAIACDEMPGDANKDCVVDLADFAELASDWMECSLPPAFCP